MVNLEGISELFFKKISPEIIVFSKDVQDFCKQPYHNKDKCPNYNSNPLCPPSSPYLPEIKEKFTYFYLAYIKIDFAKYLELRAEEILKYKKKRGVKQTYSEKELRNVIYYQNSAKKMVRDFIYEKYNFSDIPRNQKYILTFGEGHYVMEAVGIHVFKTMKNLGITLERNPTHFCYFVSLLCTKAPVKPRCKQKVLPI